MDVASRRRQVCIFRKTITWADGHVILFSSKPGKLKPVFITTPQIPSGVDVPLLPALPSVEVRTAVRKTALRGYQSLRFLTILFSTRVQSVIILLSMDSERDLFDLHQKRILNNRFQHVMISIKLREERDTKCKGQKK